MGCCHTVNVTELLQEITGQMAIWEMQGHELLLSRLGISRILELIKRGERRKEQMRRRKEKENYQPPCPRLIITHEKHRAVRWEFRAQAQTFVNVNFPE